VGARGPGCGCVLGFGDTGVRIWPCPWEKGILGSGYGPVCWDLGTAGSECGLVPMEKGTAGSGCGPVSPNTGTSGSRFGLVPRERGHRGQDEATSRGLWDPDVTVSWDLGTPRSGCGPMSQNMGTSGSRFGLVPREWRHRGQDVAPCPKIWGHRGWDEAMSSRKGDTGVRTSHISWTRGP